MRRRSVLLAVPASLLAAAGCGGKDKKSDSASSPSPSASATTSATPSAKIVDGPLPAVTAGTAFGQKPTVAKGTVTPSKDLAVKAVIPGDGPVIAAGDYVQVNYLGQVWDTAKVFDTSYGRAPYTNVIGEGKVIPGWDKGLVGQKVKSRVMLAIPPALGYGSSGNAQAGIKGTDTLVFVVDVLNRFNSKSSAAGKAVPQTNAALPKVGANTDGAAPSIQVPKTKAPTKLVSQYVIEGDGQAVKVSDNLLLQYKGVLWDTGKEFDSTYQRGQLAAFPLGNLIKGWQQGLAGKKVGSRVMLVTPPALAYGDKAQGAIPANSTLVFCLDILAVL